MYTVTDEQIEYILSDIKQNGVETEDLQLNLLDHICCILEQEVKGSADFEQCYKQTVKRFYKRDLAEIEEETRQLLTFKNYYAMKRLMIVSGAVSASAFILGSLFKTMFWQGAGFLLMAGVLMLSFIFLPMLVLLKTREADSFRNKVVLALGALVGVLYSLSTLFAMMHWPGASPLWFATVATSIFVLVPTYFFTGIRNPDSKVNTIVTTILLVSATGLLFTMLRIRQPLPLQSYSYIQNEQLLRKLQHNIDTNATINGSKLAAEINNSCNAIKGMILSRDIARTSLPSNIDEQDITIRERSVYMPETSESYALLSRLRTAVNAYNAAQPTNESKIPYTHSILDIDVDKLNTCTNIFVLNSLTQMQLSLACTPPHTALSMK